MKKKQGVVMLEVLLLLNVLLVLIVCNSKIITNNLSKLQLYQIKEDILTLNDLEYEILKEVQELAKNNDEIAQVIKNHKEDLSIKYQYKKVSEANYGSLNTIQNNIITKYFVLFFILSSRFRIIYCIT